MKHYSKFCKYCGDNPTIASAARHVHMLVTVKLNIPVIETPVQ